MPSYTNLQPGWPLWFFHGFNCSLVATGRPSTWDKRGSLKRKDVQRGVGPMIYRRIRSFTCERGAQKRTTQHKYFDNTLDGFGFFRFSDSVGVCLFLVFLGGEWVTKQKTLRWRGDVLPSMAFKIWNTKGLAWLCCQQPRMEKLSHPQVITPTTCSYIFFSCLTSLKQISL